MSYTASCPRCQVIPEPSEASPEIVKASKELGRANLEIVTAGIAIVWSIAAEYDKLAWRFSNTKSSKLPRQIEPGKMIATTDGGAEQR